jgi:large subunit ribosomal protein L40e
MIVLIISVTGKKTELIVDKDDTVYSIMRKLQDSEGIAVDLQRLIYSGKQMTEGQSLSHYEIREGATVHLLVRSGQSHTRDDSKHGLDNGSLDTAEPRQHNPRQKPVEAQSRSQSQSNPIRHDQGEFRTTLHEIHPDSEQAFDDDDYLVNPESHYNKLDILEKVVVESSEYYRTNGNYEPASAISRVQTLLSQFFIADPRF